MISDVSRTWAYLMGVDRSLRKYFSTVIISHVFRKQNFETCRCWTIILYFVTIYQYNKVRWHQCVPWNLWYLGALNTKLILHIMSNLNLELTWIYSAFSILHSFDELKWYWQKDPFLKVSLMMIWDYEDIWYFCSQIVILINYISVFEVAVHILSSPFRNLS